MSKRTKIEDSLIGTGFPYKEIDSLDNYIKMFRAVTTTASAVRRPGAAALDLAYIASGRVDGFFEYGLAPWDIAAGGLMILEAGGLIGDFDGESEQLYNGQVVAGTPKVFGAMLKLLAKARA